VKFKAKVLLVDDDPDFLEMHKAVLARNGYEVLTALNGQIKNDPLFKKIPILMVTSVAEVTGYSFSIEKDGYWMKADDFLDKPVMPDVLIGRVEKLLRKKKE
jgi:DNA-binding response OmpR family regulator